MALARRVIFAVGILAALLVLVVSSQGLAQRAGAQPAGTVNPDRPPEGEPSFRVSGEEEFAPGRILVRMEEAAPRGALAELNRRNDARVEERLAGGRVNVVDLPQDLTVEAAARRYESSPHVEYAEPDYRLEATKTPDDTLYAEYMYGLNNTEQTGGTPDADIDAPEAWNVTIGEPNTVVAVIDTGVDINHPDLDGNIWVNDGEIPNNGLDDDLNGYVDDVNGWDFHNEDKTVYDDPTVDQHGTHVAGTIAAEGNNTRGVVGVNWQAEIMPLKFLGPDGGYTSNAVKALDYAVRNGAMISNNSWGGKGASQSLQDAIGRADTMGHLFVAAAGNSGVDNDTSTDASYPASYDNPNIIAVAATNDDEGLASFSNYGDETVDLGAPGVYILSTLPANKYGFFNGTSMASPHVAGVAALLKSQNPLLDDAQLKQRILETVDPVSSLKGRTVTGGRLNAAGAVGLASTELTLSAKPSTIRYRNSTTLSGRLTTADGDPVVGRQVIIQKRPVGVKGFRKIGEVTTGLNGTYELSGVEPWKNSDFRARFRGDDVQNLRATGSKIQRVNVKVVVTQGTATSDLRFGKSRKIYGVVKPKHEGSVRVTIKRNGDVLEKRKVALNDFSRYGFKYKPQRKGTYSFVAYYPGDNDHVGNRSPIKKFQVVR
jgi:thermitase